MSTEIKKTMIGGFVVTALTLCTAAVFVFGSGDFFKKTYDYVLFFEDSIKGLSKGAPVTFRGVEIGVVKEIQLVADLNRMTTYIPVIIEVDPTTWDTAGKHEFESGEEKIEILIDKGLRAKLDLQSIVTGKYLISFDFYPNEPVNYKKFMPDMTEIPTIRGKLNKLADSLENLPVEKLFNSLTSTIDGFNSILNSDEIKNLVPTISRTAGKIETLVQDIDRMIPAYRTLALNADREIEKVGGRIEETAGAYKKLAQTLTTDIKPLYTDIRDSVNHINQGLDSAQTLIKKAEGTLDKDSPIMTELTQALKELSMAARSIRVWSDYLESHPEALIRGKGEYRR